MSEAQSRDKKVSKILSRTEAAGMKKCAVRGRGPKGASEEFAYKSIWTASPDERVRYIKSGISARKAKVFIAHFDLDQSVTLDALNLKRATINKKAKNDETLAIDDGERVLGLAKLVGQLETILESEGVMDRDQARKFDSFAWMSNWLDQPLPAFGGRKPIDLLDTMEGQAMVSKALGQIQSGAYA